ncbi:MAG: glycosyl hydrolase family 18 protein [Candidatus Paceibacterota bacterium]|jgi:spore germination protein
MKKIFYIFLVTAILTPAFSWAQTKKLEFSVWVPYWKKTAATAEVKNHLAQFSTISPFSFEMTADGQIRDAMKIKEAPWTEMITAARKQGVKVVPSIMWSDGAMMDKIFRNRNLREAHIKDIVDLVVTGKFDGIDIDYENKPASSYYGFAAFLRSLSLKLQARNKTLVCTIEPRFAPTSKYREVPTDIQYANNYPAINKYCDEIRVMTYEQTTADWKLTNQKIKLGYYQPLADVAWVSKVAVFTSQEINREKIVLGVVNYGYEYEVTDNGSIYNYKRLRSLSYQAAMELAKAEGVTPKRNSAGELSFAYKKDGATRLVWFSDAQAIADKVALAKKLGVKGVALFRLDGESDPKLWRALK